VAEYWEKVQREMQAAGIAANDEADFVFEFHFFAESDAGAMAAAVKGLGHRATTEHRDIEPDNVSVWIVQCWVRTAATEESIDASLDSLCRIADDFDNWFLRWGFPAAETKPGET
jgi:hypothetical protein